MECADDAFGYQPHLVTLLWAVAASAVWPSQGEVRRTGRSCLHGSTWATALPSELSLCLEHGISAICTKKRALLGLTLTCSTC
jgi:hypothetical protein